MRTLLVGAAAVMAGLVAAVAIRDVGDQNYVGAIFDLAIVVLLVDVAARRSGRV